MSAVDTAALSTCQSLARLFHWANSSLIGVLQAGAQQLAGA
jgi:hypothetical protein